MEESDDLKGFLLKIEKIIGRGDLQDAHRLLINFVKQLPAEPAPLKSTPDRFEGCFWDGDEFFKFVQDNQTTLLQKSLSWVETPPAKAFFWLAFIAYEWGDLEEALRYINQGLALDPTRPQMLCEKGEILKGLRLFDEAMSCYREVAGSSAWVPDSQRARAYRGLGFALIELRRLDEAESAFHESLKIEPDHEGARHELKYIKDVSTFLSKYDSRGGKATDADLRSAAARAFAEAEQITNAVDEEEMLNFLEAGVRAVTPDEPLGRALAKYEEAMRLWHEVVDFAGQAQAVFGMGRLYAVLSDIGKVIECYHQASNLWHEAGGHEAEEALALYKLGSLFSQVGGDNADLRREGLRYLEDALRLNRKANVSDGLVATLGELGKVYEALGDYDKAIGYFEQMLDALPADAPRAFVVNALMHIAKDYEMLGQLEFALSFYTRAQELAVATGDRRLEAVTSNNIGMLHARLEKFDEALRYFKQASEAAWAANARELFATILNAIGAACYMSGFKAEALRYYQRSLVLRRELKDRRGEITTLNNLGLLHIETAKWDEAIKCYRQALQISREDKNKTGEAHTLQSLGEVYYRGGQFKEARGYLEDALKIWEQIKDLSSAKRTLAYLAYTYRALEELSLSLKSIERALDIAETLRGKVYNPDWRISILATNNDLYEFYLNLLVELGHHADAFAASERGRARSLLDMLTEAGVDIRQRADPALLEHEREIERLISVKEQEQVEASNSGAPPEFLLKYDRLLDELRAQLQRTRAQLRAGSPHYAALMQPRRMKLTDVQQLLDADTLLLEYALGRERSHLWVVSHNAMEYHRLDARDVIETDADRVYAMLSMPNLVTKAGAQPELSEAILNLSRKVLAPVGAALGTAKRLLIVGDGALQSFPFAVLTDPAADTAKSVRYLMLDHEIVYLPSASTLALLRRDGKEHQTAPRSIAIFADPVFEQDDERVLRQDAEEELTEDYDESTGVGRQPDFNPLLASALLKSADDVGLRKGGKIQRLKGTRVEAEAVFSLMSGNSGLLMLDFEASRANLMATDLTRFQIVHLATHGIMDNVQPDRSGIVLSLVNEYGEPQNGYLRLHDIYNLKLASELVVLSACQTALGKKVRGEGIVGLTRGFMYAGSPRVVASLWQVHDLATADLMKLFYEGVQRNQRPVAALREAQVKMSEHDLWGKSPYYWAAFVIQGEWR